MNELDGAGSERGWQGHAINTEDRDMPHLIDLIDAAIFLSPLVIVAVMASRFVFRFAH